MNYLIGSGWWCSNENDWHHDQAPSMQKLQFSNYWLEFVRKFTNSQKILIVDSNSPVKPPFLGQPDIEYINLLKNFDETPGYFSIFQTLRTGATSAFFLGGFYALLNNMEYFVYIEQDCFISGHGIVEYAIENMKNANFSCGLRGNRVGKLCPNETETSFVIVRTSHIAEMFDKYINMPFNKEREWPECKYFDLRDLIGWKELPFGFGRLRPIDMDSKFSYAQKMNTQDMERYIIKNGKL